MNQRHVQRSSERGFTLIELSIVLVIIGLIVGGVLVGQDLIKAAEIRATVAQIEKYNSAVNTFRNKYGYLPGDIPQTRASIYGLFTLTVAVGAGKGDGNGLIEGLAAGAVVQAGEPLVLWRHLTDAQLADGSFSPGSTIDATSGLLAADATGGAVDSVVPPAKLGRGNNVESYAVSGINYWEIHDVTSIASADGAVTLANTMTPIEAFNIDSKVDDGKPATGGVRGLRSTTVNNAACATGDTCCLTYTVLEYDVGSTNGNVSACALRMRFN